MRHPVRMVGVVMGVDGCSRGWVGALLAGDGVEGSVRAQLSVPGLRWAL
jgi:hypothetical protein